MYGSGVIDDFLWVFSPATSNEYLNLTSQAAVILSALEETSSKFPNEFSMPRFPAEDGFLPFASTDNGDNVFWTTKGESPNDWTIAVMGPRSPDVFEYKSGFVEFLVDMIRGNVRCGVFPADFPDVQTISFTSTLG